MANELKLNIVANKGSGTDAVFRQIQNGLKSLADHAQKSAAALSQMGMKEAATAMAHMSTAVNQSVKAFADGGKNISKFSKTVDDSTNSTSRYTKLLEQSGITIGNHKKAVTELGKTYGTSNERVSNWEKSLKKVETAGVQLAQQFKGQRVALEKTSPYVALYARRLDTAAISQQAIAGNIRVTNGQFKILNKEGLSSFIGLTEAGARKLGMLDKAFGATRATLSDQQAWNAAKKNFTGNAAAIQVLNERIKRNPGYTAKAAAILDRYNAKLKISQKEVSKFGKALTFVGNKFKSFIGYTVAASVTAATLGSAFKLATQNIQYSQALQDLAAITGATAHELEMLDTKIREVAGSTKFSASEIADGMKMLGQSGFSATESIAAIEGVANLATGTLSSMSTSVELVTTAIRVFRKDTSETATVADIFTNAVNNSKLTIDKIKTSLNYLGPIAENANISLEETTATLMVLANAGVRASSSATGFRRVIKELVTPSEKMKTAIHEAGYALSDFDLQSNSMSDIVGRLGNIVQDAGDSIELFGLRGSSVASALVTQGVPAFEKMLAATKQQGTAAKNAATQVEGLGIKYKQIGDKAANLALAVGDAGLNGVLHVFADVVRASIDALTELISNPIVKWVIKLTVAWAAMLAVQALTAGTTLLNSIGLLGKGILLLRASAISATASFIKLNAAMLANPYVLAAAAVAALGIALYQLNKSSENTIAAQQKLYDESNKNVASLEAEIASVAKFKGPADEKLKKLDQLAKAYPAYAQAIYETKGEGEDLVRVLKEIQELEKIKAVNAAQDSIGAYAKKIEQSINSLENAEAAVNEFHDAVSHTENLAIANEKMREYQNIVQEGVEKIQLLQKAGRNVTVDDLFPKEGYSQYAEAVKKVLAARRTLTEEEKKKATSDSTSSQIGILQEEINKQKELLAAAKQAAVAESLKAEIAKQTLDELVFQNATEGQIVKAKKNAADQSKKEFDAKKEVDRLTHSILIKHGELHGFMEKDTKLLLEQAKFYGDSHAVAIAKENDELEKQLVVLGKLSEKRLESGMAPGANAEMYYKQVELARKRSAERKLQIDFEYGLKEQDLAKRIADAKKDYAYKSAEDIEKSQQQNLENKKSRIEKEIQFNKDRLGVLLQDEEGNKELIISVSTEIENKKKKLFEIESNLVKRRTQIIEDSYNRELALIDRVLNKDLEALKERHDRDIIDTDSYEIKKTSLTKAALQDRFDAAQDNLSKLQDLENVSADDIIDAKHRVEDAQKDIDDGVTARLDTIYNEQVAHAQKIAEDQKKAAADELKNIEKIRKARLRAEQERQAGIRAAAAMISGMYNNLANTMAQVSAKAVGMFKNSNLFIDSVAQNAAIASDEFAAWSYKLKTAKNMVDKLGTAIGALPGWTMLYRDLAEKWKQIVAATKEKLGYLRSMKQLQNTEVNDTTDLVALQSRLNSLRTNYKYLGEEDLANLIEGKKALQEQINAQRKLNAEKDTAGIDNIAAKLAEAEAAGVDIQNFGFDKQSADRLKQIEKENKQIEATVAAQEYADALHIQSLEAAGAKEEEIAAFKVDAENKIAEIRDPQELIGLEKAAITSRLDLERLNLEVINNIKIEQYKAELARQEELHQEKLKQIDEENARLLEGIKAQEVAVLKDDAGLDTSTSSSTVRKAAGGRIPGNSSIDSVRVLARPGEWFIRNESADHWSKKFGAGFMDGINKPFSATGQAIASAIQGASVPAMPEVVQAPKAAFATGGQVSKLGDDGLLTTVLSKLSDALKNNTSQKSNDPLPSKRITVNLQSGADSVQGSFAEGDASKLMKILQNNQMVTG